MPFRGIETRDLLERWPGLYVRVARLRHGDRVLGPDTDLVIEGFPRSANTFAVTAFQLAQTRPVHVAHHLHSSGHVIAASSRGVPTLLIVRTPRDAVVSSVLRKPALDLAAVARRYATFHEPLTPLVGRIEVAGFEQVTSSFGAVIDRLNRRYGTGFEPFDDSPEATAAVFARIDELSRSRVGDLDGRVVARPDAAKHEDAERLRADYDALPEPLRRHLADLHRRLVPALTDRPHHAEN
jgi:hypothetical protein